MYAQNLPDVRLVTGDTTRQVRVCACVVCVYVCVGGVWGVGQGCVRVRVWVSGLGVCACVMSGRVRI